jgi:glycosyltransferase involved in cell wall biosynthesis
MDSVSILIPGFRAKFFRQALTSAIAQTWENKKIIVSDDCPTDDIRMICDEFSPHVEYHRNPKPDGMGYANLINLLRLSQETYCKFLFDDDILHPFCVERMVEAFERGQQNNVNLVYSARTIIDEKNRFLGTIDFFPVKDIALHSGRELIQMIAVNTSNFIGEPSTVMFRRESILPDINIFMAGGLFFNLLTDVALFLRLLTDGNAIKVEGAYSYFRQHVSQESNSANNPNWHLMATDWANVIRYTDRSGLLSPELRVQAYQSFTNLIASQIQLKPAFTEFYHAEKQKLAADLMVAAA